ncbi:hypothetical protein, partial [Pseudomonas protegens]|uniref:hypothetical protein n=1 Tax=Pseudomonas protegens TaxID=380021 RepID=UPI001B340E0F
AWLLRLNSVHKSSDWASGVRAYHNAIGYTQALRDAELITNDTELAMTASRAEVWQTASDRLSGNMVAKGAWVTRSHKTGSACRI